jgi:lipopolysaccharide transport system permease protein
MSAPAAIHVSPQPIPVRVLAPSRGWVPLRLEDLWEYRELLYFLMWRALKVRYKQTVLGMGWAVLQPFLIMVVFSLVFGRLAHIPSQGIPYSVFSYAALVPWMYFANALGQASNSLVEHERMITKVYFPRLLLPFSAVLVGLVDFGIALVVLLVMMIAFGIAPTGAILALPVFMLLMVATALGAGVWLAALNVQYRDVRYVTPFLIQFWLFLTPVAYPSTLVPTRFQGAFGLNPMAGVIEGLRWALLARPAPATLLLVSGVVTSVGVLVSGLYYFRRTERIFADVV